MKKQDIETQLLAYKTDFEEEQQYIIQVQNFLNRNNDFYQKTNLKGHLTGSAWVVSEDRKQVLLIHHKKLNMWIQPGGHADDSDENLMETARREAVEECGLAELKLVSTSIFDVDVHQIPEKGSVPSHIHYDIRFAFETNPNLDFNIDKSEILDAQWVDIQLLKGENTQRSIQRMALKM